jgi:hypothetical protein
MGNGTTFAVTDPNGVIHTRKSRRHIYTHAVITRRSREAAEKWAREEPLPFVRHNYNYFAACAAGTHEHVQPEWFKCYGDRAEVHRFYRIAEAKNFIARHPTFEEFVAHLREEELAAIEATDWSAWSVVGWCGRRDLAEKLAAAQRRNELIAEAMIVETFIVREGD